MWDWALNWMNDTVAVAGRMQRHVWRANLTAARQSVALATVATGRLWGRPARQVVEDDRRFEDDAWQENPLADLTKQAYLITAQWMVDMADSLEAVDPGVHHQARFWTQQFADAVSPTNFAVTNPQVMREAIRTGGTSLKQGAQQLLTDMWNGRVTQVPEDAFVVGQDLAATPGKVIYRSPLIELIQYEPTTEKVHAVPMLMIPPWINKYYVMDMEPRNSMVRHLVDAGFSVFMISWKNPDHTILHYEWDDYVDNGPLDALLVVQSITGAEKVNVVGYCLGGLILQVTLAYLAARGEEDLANTATFFTTHQDFSDAGDVSVFINEPWIRVLEGLIAASGGYLDGRNIGMTFNMLRSNDLLWHYYVNNYLLGKEPPDFGLLYWNNDGTRVPGRVHMYLVREFFLKNRLIEPGGIQVKGVGVDLKRITTPTYAVTAANDHIVPWKGAFKMRESQGGPVRFILTEGGHIAGVVNPPDYGRARAHWINDQKVSRPDEWLSGAEKHEKSWWTDWVPWLAKQSGHLTKPPTMGSDRFPPIMDAPGLYVLEK